jgi:hypothetical protein
MRGFFGWIAVILACEHSETGPFVSSDHSGEDLSVGYLTVVSCHLQIHADLLALYAGSFKSLGTCKGNFPRGKTNPLLSSLGRART